jgi:formate dehydrogenase subunit delta
VRDDEIARMANQIARFFEPYPEDEAVEGIREHLRKFWSPAMRAQLVVSARSSTTSLDPLVVAAAHRLDP